MESADALKIIANRQQMLHEWLTKDCQLSIVSLQRMPSDASFRRYYRMQTTTQTYVVMDAPAPQENCAAFMKIARALRDFGILTPEIFYENRMQGFLVLTDFGDATYLKSLTKTNADLCYKAALETLARMQAYLSLSNNTLPLFTAEWMLNEWMWHKEWFFEGWLQQKPRDYSELDACYQLIIASALSQPQVFMHRDYHSGNLMLLPNHQVGVLDFQDAFCGPLTYDLVSLLRDGYIDWPQEAVKQWVHFYLQQLQQSGEFRNVEFPQMMRWFDWMGVQRHLKILMTFARKAIRDGQSNYLHYIPRTLTYLDVVCGSYPELAPFKNYIQEILPQARRLLTCVP